MNDSISKIQALVFTRYLYIKDEVRISFIMCILNKTESALFWAFELYHSGFKRELFELIWKIYYDFFATINPSYESYLIKKQDEYLKNDEEMNQKIIISTIVQELLFRKFNCDIFNIRNICENFEVDIDFYNKETEIKTKRVMDINFERWVKNNDYRSLCVWILNDITFDLNDIYDSFLVIYEKQVKLTINTLKTQLKTAIKKVPENVNKRIVLLIKILSLIYKVEGVKKHKGIYLNINTEEIEHHDTIHVSEKIKHYTLLIESCKLNIDEFSVLNLFKLTRSNYEIQKEYWFNWEYYASFSPLWYERIQKYGGTIDYIKKSVSFKEEPNDDLMQKFYSLYGLEPDEQTQETQNKNIPVIKKEHDWFWFYNKYKKNGIFEVFEEELEEFNNDGLFY